VIVQATLAKSPRDHRRGEPVFSALAQQAAAPSCGANAEYRENYVGQVAVDGGSGRASRSSCWCCPFNLLGDGLRECARSAARAIH